jgi:hypothetical protein
LALQAGVLAESANGKIFDRFRDRITFPIFNFGGEVVGFSATVPHAVVTLRITYVYATEHGFISPHPVTIADGR